LTEIAENVVIDLTAASLRDVENYIAPRLRGLMEVGVALIAVRQRRLYLQAGHDTFESYCEKRWDIGRQQAQKMCDAAQVYHAIAADSAKSPIGDIAENVGNEAQARELAPLLGEPDELKAVWEQTCQRTQGAVTAAALRQIRRERERQRERESEGAYPQADAVQPRPAPADVVPVDARRVFQVITQAVEEVRALGGPGVFRGGISVQIRQAWTAQLDAAASFVAELAEACAGRT
jgi:hypothetical protein